MTVEIANIRISKSWKNLCLFCGSRQAHSDVYLVSVGVDPADTHIYQLDRESRIRRLRPQITGAICRQHVDQLLSHPAMELGRGLARGQRVVSSCRGEASGSATRTSL